MSDFDMQPGASANARLFRSDAIDPNSEEMKRLILIMRTGMSDLAKQRPAARMTVGLGVTRDKDGEFPALTMTGANEFLRTYTFKPDIIEMKGGELDFGHTRLSSRQTQAEQDNWIGLNLYLLSQDLDRKYGYLPGASPE